jgi:hypothetical protein
MYSDERNPTRKIAMSGRFILHMGNENADITKQKEMPGIL